ncbi:hypothetical protein MUO14_20390 [Halobacillus shinanisalinarum]|uniref:DUF4059 family protein n=1 Tax=Halobacillus shinanisalinarum TaxID=2932258 RepID=A0ABY4GXG9_9BACI|nr:hypothetical protein [Halobacillus shinanisalinarum]UOQ92749.1 hypothetical protein MUO14_20390 [Halobacillus shinanisalinarum]
MGWMGIVKIVLGIIVLAFIVITIRKMQKRGTYQYDGNDTSILFLLVLDLIAIPVMGYLLFL